MLTSSTFFNINSVVKLPLIIFTALLYLSFGEFTFFLEKTNLVVAGMFIPEGISLAMGLLYGPWMALGVLIGQFLLAALNDTPYLTSVLLGMSNALCLLLALSIYRKYRINFSFDSFSDYAHLVLVSIFVQQALSALLGHFILFCTGEILATQVLSSVFSWWTANAQACFLITPLILIFASKSESIFAYPGKLWVAPALILVLVFLRFDFLDTNLVDFPVFPFLLPLLAWIAFTRAFGLLLLTTVIGYSGIEYATAFGIGPLDAFGEFAFVGLNFISFGILLPIMFACILFKEKDKYEKQITELANKQKIRADNREKQLLGTLNALSKARDNETGNHIIRTQNYVLLLARQLKKNGHYNELLSPIFMHNLFQAAPLHDIGKVGIPDDILLFPGPLSAEKWKIMQTHAMIGEEILGSVIQSQGNITDTMVIAKNIAGGHHEKWDGTGYPRGVKGKKIPLAARIMALADMYDALVSSRVYKKAWTHAEAVAEIKKLSGSHFDPKIVKAFLQIKDTFKNINKKYQD